MKKTAVKLKHTDFNMKEHGFVGHLAEPEQTNGKAVIVIMGGEQSLLPGIKIAERFADYGFTGLAVSLFGAEGLPDTPDRCPLEMFECAVDYLKSERNIAHISTYGQSMGSIFAVLTAQTKRGRLNIRYRIWSSISGKRIIRKTTKALFIRM